MISDNFEFLNNKMDELNQGLTALVDAQLKFHRDFKEQEETSLKEREERLETHSKLLKEEQKSRKRRFDAFMKAEETAAQTTIASVLSYKDECLEKDRESKLHKNSET
eukprot:TRINITY_DN3451_c0_g1_i1.p2 TRINITY_DN3451_c0_g1~~TRINITY_DN3451_c0_g1_i1.p2  ORF type:complete len:108 (+),score=19.48 TRINITY_DN3451_c0_g1_i1:228-551(+)